MTIYPSQLYSEMKTNWKYNLGLCKKQTKKAIFFFFADLGKTEKSSQSNLQKFQNVFVNWERLGRLT